MEKGAKDVAPIHGSNQGPCARNFVVLKTEAGCGISFRVYFPADEFAPNEDSEHSIHPFAVRGNRKPILIVDDEAQIRDTAATTGAAGQPGLGSEDFVRYPVQRPQVFAFGCADA
jgi:hypothetical protein